MQHCDHANLSIPQIATDLVKESPDISINDLVHGVIRRHMEHGCMFFEGAAQRVISNYKSLKLKVLDLTPLIGFLNYEESYCQRDGIDKTQL